MSGKYTLEHFEAEKQAREEREAKQKEERRERAEKGAAKRVWLADGGREADFERAWPELRDAARKQRVADSDRQARASHRAQSHSRI